ncbi:MFS transporter [Flavobacteriaceae bacterium]|nr:MFS transporter [Flavobacteriaceae bacterium]
MPILFNSIGAVTVFAIFAFMMLLQLVWIKMYVPETKGKSLEAVSESLTNSN